MAKILIVGNSTQSTDLISQCFGNTDHEIYTSESGLNALAKCNLFKPDLVILDVDLPDISGYDVCKRIKSNIDTEYTLVLFLSDIETREFQIRALEVGGDDFLEKSFDAYILLSKVRSLMRVKHLSDQLIQKYMELEEKNTILDMQLKMSRQVQRSLIPDINLCFKDVRFMSKYLPALDVGGDFYDVLKLNKDCISVVMGDVSGHGISAALLTAMLSMMIRNLVTRYFNPDQLLFYLNNEFYNIFENSDHEMYACVYYAVIDTKEQKLYYSNAGQSLPVFVDSDQNSAWELECSGLPIGLMKNSTYDFKTLEYDKGDMLMFHTDGLADAFYKDSPEIFVNKLGDILLDANPDDETEDIIYQVLDSFCNFNASEAEKMMLDDVSVVLCRM